MDDARQLEIDLLCGVIEALPCPAALLNRSGQAAYVSAKPCPVDLEAIDLPGREDIRRAISTGKQTVARTLLEDSGGNAAAWGLLELYPVFSDGVVVGALMLFHPESPTDEPRADALPTASEAVSSVWERVQRLGMLSSTVLLQGEDGTGKSGFAQALHERSLLKDKPFIRISADSSPARLLKSVSSPCTLFAHRIDFWPADLLDSFAGVLGLSGRRVTVSGDLRIIASAGPDLSQKTLDGGFPEAVYTKLHVMTVFIPPLRDRPEDIMPAAGVMLRAESTKTGKHIIGFSDKAEAVLKCLPLTENLRELRGIIQRAVDICPGGLILASHIPSAGPGTPESLRQMRQAYTVEQIEFLLEAYGDTVDAKRRAAQDLGIGLSTLYRILAKEKKKSPGRQAEGQA